MAQLSISKFKALPVTAELLRAARERRDDLFAALITAKDEWQYALHNAEQDAAYQKALKLKAEYAEWRALVERLEGTFEGAAGATEGPNPAVERRTPFPRRYANAR